MRRSGPVPMSRIEQTRKDIMATVKALADAGEVPREKAQEAFAKYRIDDPTAVSEVKQAPGGNE